MDNKKFTCADTKRNIHLSARAVLLAVQRSLTTEVRRQATQKSTKGSAKCLEEETDISMAGWCKRVCLCIHTYILFVRICSSKHVCDSMHVRNNHI